MLSKKLQEQIEQEAEHKGKNHMFIPMDGNYSSYEFHGFIAERSYLSGAKKYAALYEIAVARAERAEKALREIYNLSIIIGSPRGAEIHRIANKALTPKTGEDEQ